MRISDWSSDVCSSDLFGVNLNPVRTVSFDFALYNTTVKGFQYNINTSLGNVITNVKVRTRGIDTSLNWRPFPGARLQGGGVYADAIHEIGRASCGERVCQYGYISRVAGTFKKKT